MKIYTTFFLLLVVILSGCKKYEEAKPLSSAAYIRVFNDLVVTADVVHSQQPTPFLTFLEDPKTDASGIPNDAAVIGDYLGTRQAFSLSYPINEGNSTSSTVTGTSSIGITNINYEYPGNAHVLAAPNINGFDLSAWAQISSGKHRLMFVLRPQNNTAFKDLPANIRGNILLDTTVNFEKGEVYTLEVVAKDLDNAKYGLYVRKEQFIHQSFETEKTYVGFVNLSGKTPQGQQYGLNFGFPEHILINYSYNIYNDAASAGGGGAFFTQLPGYNNAYYTTLSTKMDTEIPYLSLPSLPESMFFYQGILRTYGQISLYSVGTGTLPYVGFNLTDADNPGQNPISPATSNYIINCVADPNLINNSIQSSSGFSTNVGITYPAASLNLIVNTGHAYHVYTTLNIIELIYNKVYMMQIQRGFDEVPQN